MKTHKIIFILMTILWSIPQSSAQWKVGLQLGITSNELSTSSAYFYDLHYRPQAGLSISVPVQYQFNTWFGLQAELSYIEKNYEQYRDKGFMALSQTQFTNSYLEIPFMGKFSFGEKRIQGFLHLGAYLGCWINRYAEGSTLGAPLNENVTPFYYFSERIPFNSEKDNQFEFGTLIGVGIEYKISSLMALTAEVRYLYSLTDLQKAYMINLMPKSNNTTLFQIGLHYTFRK